MNDVKVDVRDNNLIVFLNKRILSTVDFDNNNDLEKYFKNLFLKLNNIYNIEFYGSYNIVVYIDDHYGAILELLRDDSDYFDYYDTIDMKITISNFTKCLYKLDGIFDFSGELFFYNGNFYIDPTDYSYIGLGKLLEISDILYGRECDRIIKGAKKLIID